MFGIGGGEIVFIILVILMLFGSDKIPEIARTLGKIMAQLKNATNDIKSEIQKGAEANGLDTTINDFKSDFTNIGSNITKDIQEAKSNMEAQTQSAVEGVAQEVNELEGPVKRQF
ncbi:MAG: Sec-independent protein translocase subunit TatA/TatB [Flavobacterium sp.]